MVARRRGVSGTRVDGGVSATRVDGGGSRVALPEELASRFVVVGELRRGAEGDVLVVEDVSSGGRGVLKWYQPEFEPDPDAVQLLWESREVEGGADHVVQLLEAPGRAGGCVFELLEYCELGSLRDQMAAGADLGAVEVVEELWAAVSFVHGLGVVHRDLKPENVLVRQLDPELDLVVGDFGLLRSLDVSRVWTETKGTPLYTPPEGVLETAEVSQAWDWWSVGMMIAELASGSHPLLLPGGSEPSLAVLQSELVQRPVDLSGIGDERVGLLCAGLLVRDPRRRWGSEEVDAWLAGESPELAEDTGQLSASGFGSGRSVWFDGRECESLPELVAAFQTDWEQARVAVFQERDQVLVDEVAALAGAAGRDEAIKVLASRPTGVEVVRAFARLLVELDPSMDPVFDGVDVTPAGLEAAAHAVIEAEADTDRTAQVLETVGSIDVLRMWRRLPRMEGAAEIAESWKTNRAALAKLGPPKAVTKDQTTRARAWALLLALDDSYAAELDERIEERDPEQAESQKWWQHLHESDKPVATALALETYPTACALHAEHLEQQHQAEQQRKAKQQAQQQRQQEQEQRERLLAEALFREELTKFRRERRRRVRSLVLSLAWIAATGVSNVLYLPHYQRAAEGMGEAPVGQGFLNSLLIAGCMVAIPFLVFSTLWLVQSRAPIPPEG